jgi:hypothetical protein
MRFSAILEAVLNEGVEHAWDLRAAWINSKTGEVIDAWNGGHEGTLESYPDLFGISSNSSRDEKRDEAFRLGWIRWHSTRSKTFVEAYPLKSVKDALIELVAEGRRRSIRGDYGFTIDWGDKWDNVVRTTLDDILDTPILESRYSLLESVSCCGYFVSPQGEIIELADDINPGSTHLSLILANPERFGFSAEYADDHPDIRLIDHLILTGWIHIDKQGASRWSVGLLNQRRQRDNLQGWASYMLKRGERPNRLVDVFWLRGRPVSGAPDATSTVGGLAAGDLLESAIAAFEDSVSQVRTDYWINSKTREKIWAYGGHYAALEDNLDKFELPNDFDYGNLSDEEAEETFLQVMERYWVRVLTGYTSVEFQAVKSRYAVSTIIEICSKWKPATEVFVEWLSRNRPADSRQTTAGEVVKDSSILEKKEYSFRELTEVTNLPTPPKVLFLANTMLQSTAGHPERVGTTKSIDGYFIEVHTIGCRRDAGEDEDDCWDTHWKIYDEYSNDSVSTVLGDPSDGVFVTITPQKT